MTTTAATPSVFVPNLVTITLEGRHDPDAFYHTRSGLYVTNDFRDLVVAKAQPTEAGVVFTLKPQVLGRGAIDAEIEAELGGTHLFDESAVCAIVAGLIAKQVNGKEGALLNNGYGNLLYLGSCVVGVVWGAGRREWRVRAWRRGDGGWHAGNQVFSPGN